MNMVHPQGNAFARVVNTKMPFQSEGNERCDFTGSGSASYCSIIYAHGRLAVRRPFAYFYRILFGLSIRRRVLIGPLGRFGSCFLCHSINILYDYYFIISLVRSVRVSRHHRVARLLKRTDFIR